jgi:hypothetical protein
LPTDRNNLARARSQEVFNVKRFGSIAWAALVVLFLSSPAASIDYTVNEADSIKLTVRAQSDNGKKIQKVTIKEKDFCLALKGSKCGKKESVAGMFQCPVGLVGENLELIPVCVWNEELGEIVGGCDVIEIEELVTKTKNGAPKSSYFFGRLCDEIEDDRCVLPEPAALVMSGEIKYGKASKKAGVLEGALCVSSFKTTSVTGQGSVVEKGELEFRKVIASTSNQGSILNRPPVADAGDDQDVVTTLEVELDGSNSSDPDGDELTYSWSLSVVPIGSDAELDDDEAEGPTFTPDVGGLYRAILVVNDGTDDSEADFVTINAMDGVPLNL